MVKQLIFCPSLHPPLPAGSGHLLHDLGAQVQQEEGAVPSSSMEMAMKLFADLLVAI